MRIKARYINVVAQDFFAEQVSEYEKQYKGRKEVYCSEDKIDEFFTMGS